MNLLFIWIPKTAGTSFYSILKEKAGMKMYLEDYKRFNNTGNVTFGHACVNKLMDANIIKPFWFKNCEVISVVRNPFDRFVSLYKDYKRTGRIPQSFSQYEFAQTLLVMERKIGLYNAKGFSMCANQSDWLIKDTTIIRLENLPAYTKKYFNADLPLLNFSEDNNVMDNDCIEIVQQLYNKDFCIL